MAESINISSESNKPVTVDNLILCDPCGEDGNNIPANGYCVDCDEYLCSTCYSHHCTPRPCRHHVLQDATIMPKQRPGQRSSDAANIKCQLHPHKVISSYCKSHDQLCCESCILIGHSSCREVKKVDILAADISKNEEFKEFEKNLLDVKTQHGENKQRAMSHLKQIDKVYNDAMDKFKKRLDEMKSKDVKKMTTIINSCDTAQKQLSVWKSDKDKFHNNQQNGQLYILMKMTKKSLDMTKNNIEQLSRDNGIVTYSFVDQENNDNCVLGKLVKTPCLVKKIDVKHSSDTSSCILRDIALLGGDLMLVTDLNNKTIMLINTSINTILSHTKLNRGPFEMTVTDNNQVFVAQPGARKLLHLTSPTVDVSNITEKPVDGECYTVKYHDHKLKVQCFNPCKQIETDMNGKVLKTIHKDISTMKTGDSEPFVSTPVHSVLNEKTGSMIVSCWKSNSITEISDNGNVKLLVKSDKLQSPCGLVKDTDGSLLVCSHDGKCVFRVTGTHEIQDNILPEPMEFKPYALALDKTTRRLYVGGKHDSVLVYQL